ncbi:MAG: hypothetical protein ACOH2F_12195 [Cellulomonas sp.]
MTFTAAEIEPLAGDPDGVRTAATRYTATAEAVLAAAAELRRLAALNAAGRSEAIDALVGIAGDVAGRLDRLHGRYETAGSALGGYATALETAQGLARQAVNARDSAAGDQSNAQYWTDHYDREAAGAVDPLAQSDAQVLAARYRSSLDAAASDLVGARALYQRAVEMRDGAADTAAELIAVSIEQDGLNDSVWDNFSGWVADHAKLLQQIKDVIGLIAAGLAIASLFFPVLAPFALVAAGVAAALSLVLASTGQISWIEFGLDFLAFATMGVAAIASKALQGTMATLKTTRIATVTAQATGKSPLRMVTGSFNGVLPSRVSMLAKAKWIKEIFGAKGVANAKALRVLAGSRVGAGGAADDALVGLAKLQVGIQRAAAGTSTYLGRSDTILTGAGSVAALFKDVIPAQIVDAAGDVSEWYADVNQKLTWRVGSSW